jgi:hypothetical protein
MARMLMNPATGSVDTEENWKSEMSTWETTKDGKTPQEQFDSLVEVTDDEGSLEKEFSVFASESHEGYKKGDVIGRYATLEEAQAVADKGPFKDYRYNAAYRFVARKCRMINWYDTFLDKINSSATDEEMSGIIKEMTDHLEFINGHPSELERVKKILRERLFHVRFIEPIEKENT